MQLVDGVRLGRSSRSAQLVDWLRRSGADDIVADLGAGPPERDLVKLALALDPDLPPIFAGRSIGFDDLGALVRAAGAENWAHGEILMRLMRSGALSLYGLRAPTPVLAIINEQWQRTFESAGAVMLSLPDDVRRRVDERFMFAVAGVSLLTAVSVASGEPYWSRFHRVAFPGAAEVHWYAELDVARHDDDRVARSVLKEVLGPIAVREHQLAIETRQRDAELRAEQQRLRRRERRRALWGPNALSMLALSVFVISVLAALAESLVGMFFAGVIGLALGVRSQTSRGLNIWTILAAALNAVAMVLAAVAGIASSM